MKRKIKNMLGVVMALTMAASTTASAFAATKSVDYSGTIDDAALKINVTLPTGGAMTIKPYGKIQIDTGIGYIDNAWLADGSEADAVVYNIGIAGYSAVVGTTGEVAPVLIAGSADIDEDGVVKQVKMAIEMGAAEAVADKTTDIDDATKRAAWDAKFSTPAASLAVERSQEEKYDPANPDSVYVKTTESPLTTVAVKPQQSVPVRVNGTMNVNAAWEVGDSISVTPVFSIAPDPSAAIS